MLNLHRPYANQTSMEILNQANINPFARPIIRYLAAGMDYFFLLSTTNLLYIYSHESEWIRVFFVPMWFCYFPLLESWKGQTPGKFFFHCRVMRKDGSKLNLFDTFIRHIFDVIDFLPLMGILGMTMAAGNESKQRLGDRVAKTVVLKA